MNKSDRTISRIEAGTRSTSLQTFINMCEILDVTPNHLLSACININKVDANPTSYEQLVNILCNMETEEIELALDVLKMIQKHRN